MAAFHFFDANLGMIQFEKCESDVDEFKGSLVQPRGLSPAPVSSPVLGVGRGKCGLTYFPVAAFPSGPSEILPSKNETNLAGILSQHRPELIAMLS